MEWREKASDRDLVSVRIRQEREREWLGVRKCIYVNEYKYSRENEVMGEINDERKGERASKATCELR